MGTQATLRTALEKVLATLRAIPGTGAYNYALTGTNAVRAHVPNPLEINPPQVFVRSITGVSTPGGVPMGSNERRFRVSLACYAGGTQVLDSEVYAVIDLVSDIDRALMAERGSNAVGLMTSLLDVYQTEIEVQAVYLGPNVFGEAFVSYDLVFHSLTGI